MGKNKVIKTLGNFIGNITAHKVLIKYGNKPEAFNHLDNEIMTYGNSASNVATEFNWNQRDKQLIRQKSLQSLRKELRKSHFKGVKFPMSDAIRFLDQTMREVGL